MAKKNQKGDKKDSYDFTDLFAEQWVGLVLAQLRHRNLPQTQNQNRQIHSKRGSVNALKEVK